MTIFMEKVKRPMKNTVLGLFELSLESFEEIRRNKFD
jgi:hypothetical protein